MKLTKYEAVQVVGTGEEVADWLTEHAPRGAWIHMVYGGPTDGGRRQVIAEVRRGDVPIATSGVLGGFHIRPGDKRDDILQRIRERQ